MSRARRKRVLNDAAVLDEIAGVKRAVKAMKHLTAGSDLLTGVMSDFVDSPEVKDELPMSAAEVQRWAERFSAAGAEALIEANLYLDVCRRWNRKRR